MFGQARPDYEREMEGMAEQLPAHPRTAVRAMARHFYEFATADLARHQLMDVRILPGFEPSDAASAGLCVLQRSRQIFRDLGIASADEFDIWIAVGGRQPAPRDDPSGPGTPDDDRAIDMWADSVGLPSETAIKQARR